MAGRVGSGESGNDGCGRPFDGLRANGESPSFGGLRVSGPPLPRTSGYQLSPVRRGGCARRRVLIVAEGRVPLRRDGRFAKRPYDPLRGGR